MVYAADDMEAGWSNAGREEDVDEDLEAEDDPFDIVDTKKACVETLKRWRRAALVLNASRRFQYTLDLKKAGERDERMEMIRARAQVERVKRQLLGEQILGD